ncbi:hypothetical protein J6590_088078 [Homalodisca vitripennis]|nr:hypothetical protein J6590_088078 [Homalodisca vitripennis]
MPHGQDMLDKAIGQINSDFLSVSLWSVTNDHNLNTVKCTVLHVAPHTTVQILGEKNPRRTQKHASTLFPIRWGFLTLQCIGHGRFERKIDVQAGK